MLQVKTKIQATVLIGITGLVFIFTTVIIYLFYHQAHLANHNFKLEIKRASQNSISDLDRFLSTRLIGILQSDAILKAFQSRDPEQLNRLTKDLFQSIDTELADNNILNFYTPDTVLLFRLGIPNFDNDDLKDIRPMIAKANRLQQITRGFEVGNKDISYRVAIPVTYQGQQLGVVELGTGAEYIMEDIHKHYALHSALYRNPGESDHNGNKKGLSTCSRKNLLLTNDPHFFNKLQSLDSATEGKTLIDNRLYRFHAHNLITNFQGKEIGTLVFLQDIDQQYVLLFKIVAGTIFTSLMILAFVWVLLNTFMGKLIDGLISSEKKARLDREELTKFKVIFDNLNYGIALVDLDGRIKYINDYFAAIHGYEARDVYGRHMFTFHSDEQMKTVDKMNLSCINEGEYSATEVWHKHRNGSLFPMEMNGILIKDEHETSLYLVHMANDITERLEVKKKMAREKAFLQNIMDSISQPLYVIDTNNYKITLANSAAAKLGPISEHTTCYELTHNKKIPCDDVEHPCPLTEVKRRKQPITIEHVHCKQNDTHSTFAIQGFPVFDDHGKVVQMIEYSWDITERVQMEQELIKYGKNLEKMVAERTEELAGINEQLQQEIRVRAGVERDLVKSRKLLQSIIDNSPTIIYVKDLHGKYLLINSRFEELFDQNRNEIIGKTDYDLFPKEIACSFRAHDRQVLGSESTLQEEEVMAHEDGQHTYLSVKFPLVDDEGIIYAVAVISTDITQRKHMEQVFLKSEQRYRTLTANIPGIIYRSTTSWLPDILLNCEPVSGYEPQEFISGQKSWIDIIHPEDKKWVIEEWAELHEQPAALTQEYKIIKNNGEVAWVSDHKTAIFSENGIFRHIDGVLFDISERKHAEEQIKKTLHEKEILLKEIHHRVKNNLQIVSSLLYLQAKDVDDVGLRAVLLNSRDRVKSMALIHETLYQSEDLSGVDFAGYLRNLVEHIFRSYKNRSKEITSKINIEQVVLTIESAIPCGLILNELITNSMQHAFPERKGEICVDMGLESDSFVLLVSDNGIGFPDQVDFRNSESLGLQLVTSLVKQLGGTIELRCTHGSEFTIIFTEPSYSSRI